MSSIKTLHLVGLLRSAVESVFGHYVFALLLQATGTQSGTVVCLAYRYRRRQDVVNAGRLCFFPMILKVNA